MTVRSVPSVAMTRERRSPRRAALVALGLCASGCALLQPKPRQEPPPARPQPVEALCYALEYDASGQESVRPRQRDHAGVRFTYLTLQNLEAELARKRPQRIFLIVHGWDNDTRSARDFSSRFVLPLTERAKAAEADAVFVGVHWDSEEINFYGSAETAEKIGRRRVATLLTDLGPLARNVVIVAHSLGGRLALSALEGRPESGQQPVAAAVLLEAAVASTAFVPGSEHAFLGAPSRASLLINVHSVHDDVLGSTYATAMGEPAMGFAGARMQGGDPFPTISVGPQGHDRHVLSVAIENQAGAPYGGPVINVEASELVADHSDLTDPPLLDLIWEAAFPQR